MKFAGVVVLYNPDKKIIKNIESYINQLDKLYLVDNTPNADNSEIFNFDKKIEYIPNNDNLGIAKALNIAAEKAIKEKYDWLLTMDQDSKFKKGSLDYMIETINNLKKNSFVSKLIGVDYNKLAIVSPFHSTKRNQGESLIGFSLPLLVMTSGNLVNLNIYKKLGGYKEWMFIDCVDFDFCLNIMKNGYKILQLNNAILNHNLGDIIEKKILNKTLFCDNHNYIRRYYIVRNRHYINDLYKDDFPEYCKCEMKCTKKEALKVLLFEKDKIRKLKYMFKGYRDYKKGKKGKINS